MLKLRTEAGELRLVYGLHLLPGEGSERSHHGFRDHSYSEQHPTGRLHLFCRDSHLARLNESMLNHESGLLRTVQVAIAVPTSRLVADRLLRRSLPRKTVE
jgi:hypothetical protein